MLICIAGLDIDIFCNIASLDIDIFLQYRWSRYRYFLSYRYHFSTNQFFCRRVCREREAGLSSSSHPCSRPGRTGRPTSGPLGLAQGPIARIKQALISV